MRTLRNEVRWLLGLSLAALVAGCNDRLNAFNNNPSQGMNGTNGDTYALTSAGRLVSFNRASPTITTAMAVTGLQSGETLLGIDIRPGGTTTGQIIALSSLGRIYVIDKFSAAATLKSTLAADPADTTAPFTALSGMNYGIDFNPVVDRLRVVSDTGQDLRINVDTGLVTTDGALNVAGTARNGVVEVGYTNDFAATCRTTLFYIDATTDKLLTTADPNNGTLTEVGALGVDASASSGFEVSTDSMGNNTAFAALQVGTATNLYVINLTTGAATSSGPINGLTRVRRFAGWRSRRRRRRRRTRSARWSRRRCRTSSSRSRRRLRRSSARPRPSRVLRRARTFSASIRARRMARCMRSAARATSTRSTRRRARRP